MKSGANYVVLMKIDAELEKAIDIFFTFKASNAELVKEWHGVDNEDVKFADGIFQIYFYQADTKALEGSVQTEAQVNYEGGSIVKTNIGNLYINKALNNFDVSDDNPVMHSTEVELTVAGNAVVAKVEVKEEEIQSAVINYMDEHKEEFKGEDGKDGKDGVSPSASVQRTSTGALITITDKDGTTTAEVKDGQGGEGGKVEEYFYEYAQTSINPNKLYNYSTKKMDSTSNQYCCLYYELKCEKKVRLSGASAGSSTKVAYCFVDVSGNVVEKCDFIANETFSNLMLDVPKGAFAIFVNGNGYQSPHLEIATEADRADRNNTQYLFEAMAKRVRYREQFAWKDMPNGLICFSFDDSLDATNEIVDLFIQKNVPCCFGAIPEKLNMGLSNGETIAQAMKRGVDTVGCEVLAHGSASNEIVTADNIDDKDFLYRKFVVNKQKFSDLGFDVRGTVRVGGSGNICNDKRTDVWMKLFFDYGDLYGIEEPYNHPRVSAGNSEATDKATIDSCALNKNFTVLLFHQPPAYLPELIDYAKAKGLTICNYAYAYDNYGTTVQEKATIDRITAIESAYGNEVMY